MLEKIFIKNYKDVNNSKVNLDTYEVKLNGELVKDLKPKEIQLLYFFLNNKNQKVHHFRKV